VIVATVLGLTLPSALHPTHRVQGVVSLIDSGGDSTEGDWDNCSGTGGYSDVTSGAAATIKDAKGQIIGSMHVSNMNEASLKSLVAADSKYGLGGWGGSAADLESTLTKAASVGAGCMLYFSGDVDDSSFYSFEFAKRGALTFSADDLNKSGWWIAVSLGDD
jgi:hypothetical protein